MISNISFNKKFNFLNTSYNSCIALGNNINKIQHFTKIIGILRKYSINYIIYTNIIKNGR